MLFEGGEISTFIVAYVCVWVWSVTCKIVPEVQSIPQSLVKHIGVSTRTVSQVFADFVAVKLDLHSIEQWPDFSP